MEVLIVDGHSMLFAWKDLHKVHMRNAALARDQLARLLIQYGDAAGQHVVVVFDGRGARTNESKEWDGIQVFYSSAKHSADQIIERLTAKYASTRTITVATNDHLEQQTAISFGAFAITSEELRGRIADADADLAKRLAAHRKKLR